MIAVEQRGRLGNQLFQFAFGLAAAARLDTDFVMNDDLLRRLFTLGPYGGRLARSRRALRYRIDKLRAPYPVLKIDNDGFERPEDVLARLSDQTHYAGFFQSAGFFADAAEDVRAAFLPLPRHVGAFRERYADLLTRRYVCCHVRRTDYVAWMNGVALPETYYDESLEILARGEETPVVFVGDDLTAVRAAFEGRRGVRFEQGPEIVDLQLLIHADALVASNSSFAWWGAWLGPTERRVLAPRHWLGFKEGREWPPAVVPPAWQQVPVRLPESEAAR